MNRHQKLGFLQSVSVQTRNEVTREIFGIKRAGIWQSIKDYKPFAAENLDRTSKVMAGAGGALAGGVVGAIGSKRTGGSAGKGFLLGAGLGTAAGVGVANAVPGQIAKGFLESRTTGSNFVANGARQFIYPRVTMEDMVRRKGVWDAL